MLRQLLIYYKTLKREVPLPEDFVQNCLGQVQLANDQVDVAPFLAYDMAVNSANQQPRGL